MLFRSAEPNYIYKEYPAHLHIDLLPQLQGLGCGRKLMEVFFNALRELEVPGLHLGVDSANEGAIKFYEKLGFSVLKEETWGFKLGIKL